MHHQPQHPVREQPEGNYSSGSDYEDYVDNQRNGKACLPMAMSPMGNPEQPPICGKEYLRRVREEADSLPSVFNMSSHFVDISSINAASDTYEDQSTVSNDRPMTNEQEKAAQWLDDFGEWFSYIRSQFALYSASHVQEELSLPAWNDRNAWFTFLHSPPTSETIDDIEGEIPLDSSDDNDDEEDGILPTENMEISSATSQTIFTTRLPKPSLLCDMSQPLVLRLLTLHEGWIAGDRPSSISRRCNNNTSVDGYQQHLHTILDSDCLTSISYWLFALLVRVDTPLTSEQLSILRELAKVIQQHLLKVNADLISVEDQELQSGFHLIVTIIAVHFGQRDLLLSSLFMIHTCNNYLF